MSEKFSAGVRVVTQLAVEMRSGIIKLGGERSLFDSRSRWLERAAHRAGISFRSAKAMFYCEDHDYRASTVEKVRRAIAAREKEEADARAEERDIACRLAALEARMAVVDEEFHRFDVEAIRATSPRAWREASRHSEEALCAGEEDRAVDEG